MVTRLVSMGGCIASALTDWSGVEVVVRCWGLSAAEQDEVWARWRQGESLRLIARRLGKRGPSVRAFVLQSGGVQRHPPRRASRSLTALYALTLTAAIGVGLVPAAVTHRERR